MTDPTPRPPLVGILENVRSLWNVGSIFRSADGAGVGQLLLCGFTAHPPRKEISKTALGAEEAVPWEYWSRAPQACQALREAGYLVLALEQTPTSQNLAEIELSSPVAFVVGHEITGVSAETLAQCDGAVHLPMRGMKQSLNVAVAFGVAAYGLSERLERDQIMLRRRREIS